MAEINPPLYLDQDDAYSAADLGLPFRDIMGEGIVGTNDLKVSQNTGSDMKSSIAAGAAWVKGDDDANLQPTYRIYNDAPVLLQHDAADATNPRIDLIVAQVEDSAFSGVSKLWQLTLVKGTPAASPAAPTAPADSLTLAQVLIPAGSGAVVNANITDKRLRAKVGGGASVLSFDASQCPGYELNYVQRTTGFTTTSASFVEVVTGGSVTYDGSTRVKVEVWASRAAVWGSPSPPSLAVMKDGAAVALVGSNQSAVGQVYGVYFDTPAAGSHHYALGIKSDGTTTTTFYAGTGGSDDAPAFVRVTRA